MISASQYGVPGDWLLEPLTTVMLGKIGGKTRVTLRHEPLPAGEQRETAGYGWNESFDRLEACVVRVGTVDDLRGGQPDTLMNG